MEKSDTIDMGRAAHGRADFDYCVAGGYDNNLFHKLDYIGDIHGKQMVRYTYLYR